MGDLLHLLFNKCCSQLQAKAEDIEWQSFMTVAAESGACKDASGSLLQISANNQLHTLSWKEWCHPLRTMQVRWHRGSTGRLLRASCAARQERSVKF